MAGSIFSGLALIAIAIVIGLIYIAEAIEKFGKGGDE